MTAAEKYVAGAYLVVFLTVLAYVLIIALKLNGLAYFILPVLSAAPSATSCHRLQPRGSIKAPSAHVQRVAGRVGSAAVIAAAVSRTFSDDAGAYHRGRGDVQHQPASA